jgi:hypothetical protein
LTRVRAWQVAFCFGGRSGEGGSGFFSRKMKAACLFFSRKLYCLVCTCLTCAAAKLHRDGQLLPIWTRSKLSSIIIIIIIILLLLFYYYYFDFSVLFVVVPLFFRVSDFVV